MTDKPAESAVERYETERRRNDYGNTCGAAMQVHRLADAALAELKAEVERVKADLRFITNYTTSERERKALKRAEAAEAKILQLGIEKDAEEYRANVAEAERDRLRWMLGYHLEATGDPDCDVVDAKMADLAARYVARHFTPSRWQEREA